MTTESTATTAQLAEILGDTDLNGWTIENILSGARAPHVTIAAQALRRRPLVAHVGTASQEVAAWLAVDEWLLTKEAGVYAGARDRAYTRPGYVNVDAAIKALGGTNDTWHDGSVRGDLDLQDLLRNSPVADRHSVLKRLLAAFSSAWCRGNVSFTAEPIGKPWSEEYGAAWTTWRHVRLTVESSGGYWSSRQYRMVTVLLVRGDRHGVVGYETGRGCVRVTGRDGLDRGATLFGGNAVGRMIARLWMESGPKRAAIYEWTRGAAARPAWHAQALRGLAELAAGAGAGGLRSLAEYLRLPRSPESDARLLEYVLEGVLPDGGAVDEALDAWMAAGTTWDLEDVVRARLGDAWRDDDVDEAIRDWSHEAIEPGIRARLEREYADAVEKTDDELRASIIMAALETAQERGDENSVFMEFNDAPTEGCPFEGASDAEIAIVTAAVEAVGWTTEIRWYDKYGQIENFLALVAVPPAGWDSELRELRNQASRVGGWPAELPTLEVPLLPLAQE